jgi:hypothetical protein
VEKGLLVPESISKSAQASIRKILILILTALKKSKPNPQDRRLKEPVLPSNILPY